MHKCLYIKAAYPGYMPAVVDRYVPLNGGLQKDWMHNVTYSSTKKISGHLP